MSCINFKEYAENNDLICKDIINNNSLGETAIRSAVEKFKNSIDGGESLDLNEAYDAIIEIISEYELDFFEGDLKEVIKSALNPNKSSNIDDNVRFINLDSYTLKNTESLDSVFSSESDIIRFRNFAKSKLIRYTNINVYDGREVDNITSLNNAIKMYQNELATNIANSVGLDKDDAVLWSNGKFNEDNYNKLIAVAADYYSPLKDSVTGKYSGNSVDVGFMSFILLANFDSMLEKYTEVKITPMYRGIYNTPSKVLKYFQGVDKLKESYDENVSASISTQSNKSVSNYISSIPLMDKDGNTISGFVQFRDFNSLLRIIKNSVNNIQLLRDYPTRVISEIFEKIKNNPNMYFTGSDRLLLNTFYAVYYDIFSNNNSLKSRNDNNLGITKNNLYSMICNHINKMAAVSYRRIQYDREEGQYKRQYLDSESIEGNKMTICNNIMLHAAIDNLDHWEREYGFKLNKVNNKYSSVDFTIGGKSFNINLETDSEGKKSDVTIESLGIKAEDLNKPTYRKFFKDILFNDFGDLFFDGIINADKNSVIYTNGFPGMFKLAAYIYLSNQVQKEIGRSKSLEDTKEAIKGLINIGSDSDSTKIKDSRWFNSKTKFIRVEGLDGQLINAANLIARAISYLNKDSSRNNVKISDNSSLSKYRLTCLDQEDTYMLSKNNMFGGVYKYNLFTQNLDNYNIMQNFFQTEVVTPNGKATKVKDMEVKDLLYNQFIFGYLFDKENSIDIQQAVYADKSTIIGKNIDLNRTIKFKYKDFSFKKKLKDATFEDLNDLIYYTNKGQYEYLRDKIVKDYEKVYKYLTELYGNSFNVNNFKYNNKLYSKLTDNNDKYLCLMNNLNKLNKKLLSEATIAAKKQGDSLSLVEDIHYSSVKGKLDKNSTLLLYISQYLNKKNFNLRQRIEDRNYAECLRASGINFSLKNNDFENKLSKSDNTQSYIESILSMYDDNINKNKIRELTKGKYGEIWINNDTQELIPYLVFTNDGTLVQDTATLDLTTVENSDNYVVILNPELKRFKQFDNLITDNYLPAIVGYVFAHPSKADRYNGNIENIQNLTYNEVVNIKKEEAERTKNFNKRGVQHGATGHTYIKNKLDGIGQYINIAVIEDLKARDMGIIQDNSPVDQFDGAIFELASQSIWEKNSLPELGLGEAKKPLGISAIQEAGGSTLLKCAVFTLNNMVIRNSITSRIKVRNLIREMMSKPWLIPNLDLSEYLTSSDFYYANTNNLGTYYKINFVEDEDGNTRRVNVVNGKVDNIYTYERILVDENGKIIEGSESETLTCHINNNFDLWEVLGGEYSASLTNNKLEIDESSWESLAEVANSTNINNDDIEELNEELSELGINYHISKINISEFDSKVIYENVENTNPNKIVIPIKYLKENKGDFYFQPMKYSDIHYLANGSAVKNGQVSINSSNHYYNSVSSIIQPFDKLVYAMSTIGKTTAKKMGYNIIDFDDILNENKVTDNGNLEQIYELLTNTIDNNPDKQIFFSSQTLLKALSDPNINTKNYKIDTVLTRNQDSYRSRIMQRDGITSEKADSRWTEYNNNLNNYLNLNPEVRQIDSSNNDLYDYLDGGSLNSFEFDPNYLLIQLNYEHEIDNEDVSEMTQVMSSMLQGTFNYDDAIEIYKLISKYIKDNLDAYDPKQLDTVEGKKRLYKLLVKSLIELNSSRDENVVSLASSYLNKAQEIISKNGNLEELFNIPLDDNNIIGSLESNLKSKFTNGIIRRHFPGFSAILNPSHDMYSIYEYEKNGSVELITSQDFMRYGKGMSLSKFLESLDREVPPSEIFVGDWVEIDGKQFRVGTLTESSEEDVISLWDIKTLKKDSKIKKLCSKGRNIRSQNYIVSVEDSKGNLYTFDLYDLDSVLLGHNLKYFIEHKNDILAKVIDPKSAEKEDLKDVSMRSAWNRLIAKFGEDLNKIEDEDTLRKYVNTIIQEDLNAVQDNNMFRVPIRYAEEENQLVNIEDKQYIANELVVGKPFATKFMLEVNDTLSDISVDYFKKKLEERSTTRLNSDLYHFFFAGPGHTLHFYEGIDGEEDLRKEKGLSNYDIVEKEIDTTINNKGETIRIVNNSVSYPVSDNMKFFELTDKNTGEKFEVVTGAHPDVIKSIKNSKVFYTYNGYFESLRRIPANRLYGYLSDDSFWSLFANTRDDISKSAYIKNQTSQAYIDAKMAKQARIIYQSFKENLKMIAARIPAQSMQSFMNMKIVGFLETQSALAYVPTNMLVYEGSDFKLKFYTLGI